MGQSVQSRDQLTLAIRAGSQGPWQRNRLGRVPALESGSTRHPAADRLILSAETRNQALLRIASTRDGGPASGAHQDGHNAFGRIWARLLNLLGIRTHGETAPPQPVAPPRESLVQAWFTDTYETSNAVNEAKARKNPGNPDKHLIKLIDRAQHTIDAALFEIDEPGVVDALIRAKADPSRKVEIRIVMDSDYYTDRDDRTMIHPQVQRLIAAGIPIVQDERPGLMHNKFFVVDREIVWTGSLNISRNGVFKQNNNAIQLKSKDLASNFTEEFEEMFVDKAFGIHVTRATPNPFIRIGEMTVETLFGSDDEVNARLAAVVRDETTANIRFMAFSFTDDVLGKTMRDLARDPQRRVTVEGVFERTGALTKYSEYSAMKAAGLDVHRDGNQSFMHHKIIILDESTLITGSFNFSKGADTENDENLLIIRNAPELVRQYRAEFDRVKTTAIIEQNRRDQEAKRKAAAAAKATRSGTRDGAMRVLPAA